MKAIAAFIRSSVNPVCATHQPLRLSHTSYQIAGQSACDFRPGIILSPLNGQYNSLDVFLIVLLLRHCHLEVILWSSLLCIIVVIVACRSPAGYIYCPAPNLPEYGPDRSSY